MIFHNNLQIKLIHSIQKVLTQITSSVSKQDWVNWVYFFTLGKPIIIGLYFITKMNSSEPLCVWSESAKMSHLNVRRMSNTSFTRPRRLSNVSFMPMSGKTWSDWSGTLGTFSVVHWNTMTFRPSFSKVLSSKCCGKTYVHR